jgi:uncharacterized protein YfaT (DUF1175 family)
VAFVLLGSTIGLAILAVRARRGWGDRLIVSSERPTLPADGREHLVAEIRRRSAATLEAADIHSPTEGVRLVDGKDGRVEALLFAPVNPGERVLGLDWRGTEKRIAVTFVFSAADSFADGTPDFLRLHSVEDQRAFRSWFSGLAEDAAGKPQKELPAEIGDCAALLRYAYREALKKHDENWLEAKEMTDRAAIASITQYHYPDTPLGASLFRVRAGTFQADDLRDGSFAQFADARTLMQRNTHFIAHDVQAAQVGDLLFYRQLEQNSPYHSMIVTGEHAGWAVYHTGPSGRTKGEMRRVSIEDLEHHPDARWRPLPENSNFLGVYRWNILRDAD